jgi:hypothetical protein
MTIFAVLLPQPNPALEQAIKTAFPADHFVITNTQFLVSSPLTAIALTAKIGVYNQAEPQTPSVGNAVIFATSSYYGRAPTALWDWIKAKLEAPSHG